MECLTLALGLIGILVAIGIPLWIEFERRPRLSIELGDPADREVPPGFRIVHARVVNRPISGWRGRWLLRNRATGCRVTVSLRSRDNPDVEHRFEAKWSSTPEPIQQLAVQGGFVKSEIKSLYKPEMYPATLVVDVASGDKGEVVAIAIKHDDEPAAYFFAPELIYQDPGRLRHNLATLTDSAYDVTVEGSAGEIKAQGQFVLRNSGNQHRDMELTAPG